MRRILKCEWLSFPFLNTNRSHSHSTSWMRMLLIIILIQASRAVCPALLCESDILPHGLRASVHVRIRPFLVVCKSDGKNFLIVQIRQWISLKTPAISNCVRILCYLVEYVQIRHVFISANPTIFLWVLIEGVWLCEFEEKSLNARKMEDARDGAAVLAWNASLLRFWR